MRKEKGFTLIELLVTLAIAIVMLAVGIPMFGRTIESSQLTTATNRLVTSLQYARSEAVKRAGTVTACSSSNGTSCAGSNDWQIGWIVFLDEGTTGSVDSGDSILAITSGDDIATSVSTSQASVSFRADGSVI